MQSSLSKNILLGLAVGDALGVPAEFKSREILKTLNYLWISKKIQEANPVDY